ncbi:MAG: nucleotidyltransferase family protein [Bacteriovoracaceae bacterium]|nr:nucleotidyltransferase family protein [Bacteriovoracaceae bacterium]
MRQTKALLLAAGLGTRLKPLTDIWPKCLMPIQGRPLLEYWLSILKEEKISNVLLNTHYFSEHVDEFLNQPQFKEWIDSVYEKELLGTAGTIRENIDFFQDSTVMLAHADNWTCCDFSGFLEYHHNQRPKNTVITMMTFQSFDPSSCGIVELDNNGVVIEFHEKVEQPPSNLANAAVYLLEPEVVKWISSHPEITDFSTEVLPKFMGKIATWENRGVHRDIGTIQMLRAAQIDTCKKPIWEENSHWQQDFLNNPIHKLIKENHVNTE